MPLVVKVSMPERVFFPKVLYTEQIIFWAKLFKKMGKTSCGE